MENMAAVIGTATINVETKPRGFWIEVGDTVQNLKRIRSSDWPRRELEPFTELKVLKVDQTTNHRGIAVLDVTTEDQDYVWKLWADEIEKVVYEEQADGQENLLEEIRDLLKEILENVKPVRVTNSYVTVNALENEKATAEKIDAQLKESADRILQWHLAQR